MPDDIFDVFRIEEQPAQRRRVPSFPQRIEPAPYKLQKLARDYTEEAWGHLLELINDPETENSTRLEAIKLVFDRGWGKPTVKQEIESRHINVHETLKALAATVQPPRLHQEESVVEADDVAVSDA